MRVVFTEAAKADIREILRVTRIQFGAAQVPKYRALISDARRRLRDFPALGHHRPGLPTEARLLHLSQPGRPASHFILYRFDESRSTVEVIRVLHEAMDIPSTLLGR